jgi:predicted AlkP superfamily phosphohydrolase/phosphomutase
MCDRLFIFGIDGVPFDLMNKMSATVMPNFNKLKTQGIFKKMKSSIPEISSVSWSSIITGKNPGEHGIYGFTELIPNTYSLSFPNFNNLKAKPFWQIHNNKKSIILNVPSTYPASELNGILISGFVSLNLEQAIYPKQLIDKLKNINYKIDVDSQKGHISTDLFLKDLFETLDTRKKALDLLWNQIPWEIFMFVVTGSDRLGHFLWEAYEDKKHKYHSEFMRFFTDIDKLIGNVISKLDKDDSIIILSDHGMGNIKTEVNVNAVLKKANLLHLKKSEKISYNNILSKSKAFILDPSRIYIHKKNRYPKGSVDDSEISEIISKIKKTFNELEFNGEKVIKRIYKKDELYVGEYVRNAPDLILLANDGFALRGNLTKENLFNKQIFTGNHTYDDAFLFVSTNKTIKIPEEIDVMNVVSIINQIIGDKY